MTATRHASRHVADRLWGVSRGISVGDGLSLEGAALCEGAVQRTLISSATVEPGHHIQRRLLLPCLLQLLAACYPYRVKNLRFADSADNAPSKSVQMSKNGGQELNTCG